LIGVGARGVDPEAGIEAMIETDGPATTDGPVSHVPSDWDSRPVARRAFITTIVAVGTIVLTLALWKLRIVVALLLSAITIAAAMRPGVEWLARRRVPRVLGILAHYVAFLGLVALFLSFVVPRLTTEVQAALAAKPQAHAGGGIKAKILNEVEQRLHHLPAAGSLVHPALSIGEEALKVLVAILFTFAAAAYWIFERDRAVNLVASLIARPKRKKLRDTWELIEAKLGAFIRGQLIMIAFVCTIASALFLSVGEPYWLLIGIGAGIFEVVPVVGPAIAIAVAAGAGLTASWHVAAAAGGGLLVIRMLQDYLVSPRVLGGAVGLPPLVVLVSVTCVTILFGSFYVLLSVPIASLVVTIVDVVVRGVDPAETPVPTVLFTSKDAEA
jgi:predicted PurR-regulated permease PerM